MGHSVQQSVAAVLLSRKGVCLARSIDNSDAVASSEWPKLTAGQHTVIEPKPVATLGLCGYNDSLMRKYKFTTPKL